MASTPPDPMASHVPSLVYLVSMARPRAQDDTRRASRLHRGKESAMPIFRCVVTAVAVCVISIAVGPAAGTTVQAGSGTWRPLPRSPIAPEAGVTSVWTGRELIVTGVAIKRSPDGAILEQANVAAAYDPARGTWRRLATTRAPADLVARHSAVWTGKQVLVRSAFDTLVYEPRSNRWRRIARGHGGLTVWTGRELIGWGGGCCGDAFSDGVAYDPATGSWRTLARSPLAGSQQPIGVWTGRELLVFVGRFDPEGRPWPRLRARAA